MKSAFTFSSLQRTGVQFIVPNFVVRQESLGKEVMGNHDSYSDFFGRAAPTEMTAGQELGLRDCSVDCF